MTPLIAREPVEEVCGRKQRQKCDERPLIMYGENDGSPENLSHGNDPRSRALAAATRFGDRLCAA